jgi:enoyl-CoA hydratase/carnithine racemase
MFSSGVNLYEMKNNDEYLDRLYGLVGMIAKENKPIISYCRGSVRNVGAYVLSMSAFVMSNGKDVSLRIDEASKGFVPLAGGTHRLSRLPANIGVYLAITGKKLNANEMSRLGFIHGVSKEDVTSKMMRHEITKSNLFFRRKLKVNFEDS